MSKLLIKKISTLVFLVSILSACNPAILTYQLDPGIDDFGNLADDVKIVAMKVSDSRTAQSGTANNAGTISGPKDEAAVLQSKLIAQLKQNGHKIISKPLLADLAFEVEIIKLKLSIEASTFKSKISGKSEIKVTVNKRGQTWSKIFRATRSQEVANPANNIDATGVMNQMLTKQLSSIFSDASFKEFIAKSY